MSEESGPYSIIDCCQRDIMAEGYEPPMNSTQLAYMRQLVDQIESELHHQENVHPMRINLHRFDALILVKAAKQLLMREKRS